MTCVEPHEIRNKKMVVVEGKDDVGFFYKLTDFLGLTDIYVMPVEGKGNFPEKLSSLRNVSGFSKLTHLAIIRDRDEDNAFESVINILKQKMRFAEVPDKPGQFVKGKPKVGVFIMPGEAIGGKAIEDLCLKTVEEHSAMQCVSDFADCVSKLEISPSNLSKAKVQAFLAAQPEIANTIGRGAQKGYWDFDSPALGELKAFLEHLR